ncbi:MAG: guanylate kinase [Candidatus Cohnella colombiensis]|uniref:Guanylate kinase n=1 Tax=Candidatus Cohnella colombiensis TaxID=3121368 RepID=A0AA95JDB1_9BACL|nr:MAG: guanylate kinase [Cohnella sp.]
MANPKIIVFTGTSGSGRKTVARRVGAKLGWGHVLSCTTRPVRNPSQPDGDYNYMSEQQFAEADENGQFVQTVVIDKHKYGIRHEDLLAAMSNGQHVYVILNRDGADAFKRKYGDQVIRLFIYVDKQTVRERLETKGMAYEVVENYLEHYMDEVTYRRQCEHVVENVELGRTIEQISQLKLSN